jgi:hypothetical protein
VQSCGLAEAEAAEEIGEFQFWLRGEGGTGPKISRAAAGTELRKRAEASHVDLDQT